MNQSIGGETWPATQFTKHIIYTSLIALLTYFIMYMSYLIQLNYKLPKKQQPIHSWMNWGN